MSARPRRKLPRPQSASLFERMTPDAAAALRALFQPAQPTVPVNGLLHVQAKPEADWIILDRINEAPQPPYCIHGRAQCQAGCGMWCWLGNNSRDIVARGDARPICKPCAKKYASPDMRTSYNANDHRRADGPHD